MRWIDRKSAVKAVALAAGLFGFAGTALAEPIVVRYEGSNAQTYKAGKTLAANARLTLKAGEILTILDDRGTRTLRGPGTFNASSNAAAPKPSQASLASLIATTGARRARTGAVRGTQTAKPAIARSPNLWFVDVSKPGTVCVADFSTLQFWRGDTKAAQTLRIADAKSGAASSIAFDAGRTTARWPAQMAAAAGAKYTVAFQGAGAPVEITFAKVAITGNESLEALASMLSAQGCQAQFNLLADTFAQTATAAT
jgi:hypothetical protein